MKHSEHDENIAAIAKEDAVWKPPGYRSTNIVSYQRVHERRFGRPVNRGLHFAKEVFTESGRCCSYQAAASRNSACAARRKTTRKVISPVERGSTP
jgi:hypothetical protein